MLHPKVRDPMLLLLLCVLLLWKMALPLHLPLLLEAHSRP